ncbi:DUF1990 domain-containing protein [Nocardiopsis exhalans]|uniref:DUF1990 domain-containing protein n=1 Tax=Nocardiopsis exhalans TaxID=163604 RepID=A0ABY5D5K4_9ACTN|nr:DUF1990 domain-containing protein [Nocardiopsis exhalans]USY18783.1 DUF1990 domain-containing protein [Nocardiopsis exhalans]
MHHEPFRESPFNYASVGATRPEDPTGARPRRHPISEVRAPIGSGQARWEHAGKETLSWGIQRRAGYSILPRGRPQNATRDPERHEMPGAAHPRVLPGLTVQLRRRIGPLPMKMPVRVVYVLDEPNRKGFAFGTLAGHPVSGEAAFIVERSADDSVRFVLRSFSGPGQGMWRLAYPIVLLLRRRFRESYLEALAGPLD